MSMTHPPDPRSAIQDLYIQLLAFNRRNARLLGISDTDLAVLDLIHRSRGISPTELAQRTHTHPATMTGILKRLEKGGWITRSMPEKDHRAVVITFRPEREATLKAHYAQTDSAIENINQATRPDVLAAVDVYLRRATRVIQRTHSSTDD